MLGIAWAKMHKYMLYMCVTLILLITVLLPKASTEKILLLPFPWPSHQNSLEIIGIELLKREHEVIVIVPSTQKYLSKTVLNRTFYEVHNQPENTFVNVAEKRLQRESGFGLSWLQEYSSLLYLFGKALMEDKDVEKLALQADVVLSDTALLIAPIFASYYRLPLIFLSPFGHLPAFSGDLFGSIENPSYVHGYVSTSLIEKIGFSEKMNFFQRSFNIFTYFVTKIARSTIMMPNFQPLAKKYVNKTVLSLWREASLVLIPMDFALEFARPESPNVKMIGPLTPFLNKSSLPQEFSLILNKSKRGVIVISFGAMDALHPKYVPVILDALLMTEYDVIWRYNTTKLKGILISHPAKYTWHVDSPWLNLSPEEKMQQSLECECDLENKELETSCASKGRKETLRIHDNIHVFDWLPQQQLLQQNNTVLFITHCGTNSVYEALFHKQQILCLPLFGDQFDNAGRVVSRNLGKAITLVDLTTQSFLNVIQNLIADETSKQNVLKASKRLRRSKQSAAERAADWIEIVLDEKGDMSYLRPVGTDLPMLVYCCIDVVVFWGFVLIFAPLFIMKLLLKKRN